MPGSKRTKEGTKRKADALDDVATNAFHPFEIKKEGFETHGSPWYTLLPRDQFMVFYASENIAYLYKPGKEYRHGIHPISSPDERTIYLRPTDHITLTFNDLREMPKTVSKQLHEIARDFGGTSFIRSSRLSHNYSLISEVLKQEGYTGELKEWSEDKNDVV